MALRRPSAAINKRRRLVLQPYSIVEMLTTLNGPVVIDAKARYWSKIAIFAPVRGHTWNIAIRFGIDKLELCGYPIMKEV